MNLSAAAGACRGNVHSPVSALFGPLILCAWRNTWHKTLLVESISHRSCTFHDEYNFLIGAVWAVEDIDKRGKKSHCRMITFFYFHSKIIYWLVSRHKSARGVRRAILNFHSRWQVMEKVGLLSLFKIYQQWLNHCDRRQSHVAPKRFMHVVLIVYSSLS